MKRKRFTAAVCFAALVLSGHSVVKSASPPDTPRSPDAVQAEVDALKKDDAPLRSIAWKTCLLEGLKASREQHKPVMLWIFIDRPADDERC